MHPSLQICSTSKPQHNKISNSIGLGIAIKKGTVKEKENWAKPILSMTHTKSQIQLS